MVELLIHGDDQNNAHRVLTKCLNSPRRLRVVYSQLLDSCAHTTRDKCHTSITVLARLMRRQQRINLARSVMDV